MSDISDNIRSSPTSTNSGNLSSDLLPSSLVNEELQLALNKVLLSIHYTFTRYIFIAYDIIFFKEATEEELLKAINHCKQLVLESDQCSSERKWLVRHLIELRLRYQECKEALADPQ